jgi:hypothetical protein
MNERSGTFLANPAVSAMSHACSNHGVESILVVRPLQRHRAIRERVIRDGSVEMSQRSAGRCGITCNLGGPGEAAATARRQRVRDGITRSRHVRPHRYSACCYDY